MGCCTSKSTSPESDAQRGAKPAQAASPIEITAEDIKKHTMDHKACVVCGKPDTTHAIHRCARCKYTLYCGKDCQRADWPTHKQICEPNEDKFQIVYKYDITLSGSKDLNPESLDLADDLTTFYLSLCADDTRKISEAIPFEKLKSEDWKQLFTFHSEHPLVAVEIALLGKIPEPSDTIPCHAKVSLLGALADPLQEWIPLEKGGSVHVAVAVSEDRFQFGLEKQQRATCAEPVCGHLKVQVRGAQGLPTKDYWGKSDPFVRIEYGATCFRSVHRTNTNSPSWNVQTSYWIPKDNHDQFIKFSVYDKDSKHDDLIGTVLIDVDKLTPGVTYDRKVVNLAKVNISDDTSLSDLKSIQPSDLSEEEGQVGAFGALSLVISLTSCDQLSKEYVSWIMKEYDRDNNGSINYAELNAMLDILQPSSTEAGRKKMFTGADKNHDDMLNVAELEALFQEQLLQDRELMSIISTLMTSGREFQGGENEGVDNAGVQIKVQDRKSGLIVTENIPLYLKTAMRLAYRTDGGQMLSELQQVKKLRKYATIRQGVKMDHPSSAKGIPAFVAQHKLNLAEVEGELADYKTMNQFFYRKLRAGTRLCAHPSDPAVAVSPADCRLTVFPTLADAKKLWIKGEAFSSYSILGAWGRENKNGDRFSNCAIAVARLAPQDYHRWHFPVSGSPGSRVVIEGDYHTVNPIAIRKNIDVFSQNKRVVCPIETKEFGTVVLIAVAAAMVGSIHFECDCKDKPQQELNCLTGECKTGRQVNKFDPHGYFAFGGSTTLVLFQQGTITFDSDLVTNSKNCLETLVQVGDSLGRATGKIPA